MSVASRVRGLGPRELAPILLGLGGLFWLMTMAALVASSSTDLLVYLVVATVCLIAMLVPTHIGIAILIGYASVAGILKEITNYVFLVHLSNDAVFASVLVGYVGRRVVDRGKLWVHTPLDIPIAILVGAALLLTLAPWTTPIQALGGWKAYVIPSLIVPLAATAFRCRAHARPLFLMIIIVGLLNAVASLVELQVGRDAIAAWGGPGFAGAVGLGSSYFDLAGHSAWRPFGLTQDAGTAALTEVMAVVTLSLLAVRRKRGRALCIILLALPLGAVLSSGVRSGTVLCVAGVLALLLLVEKGRGARPFGRNALVVASVALVGLILLNNAPPIVRGRAATLLDPAAVIAARGSLVGSIGPILIQHPLGAGMGKIVPAGLLLSSLAGVAPDAFANENMLLAMAIELGLLGAAFVVALWAVVGRGLVARLRSGQGDEESDLGFAICIVLAAGALSGPLIVAQPANLLLWVFATLVLSRADPIIARA